MTMSSSEISKTQFKDNYNVFKVLTNKTDIMKQLETFNSNNQAVAFGVRKKPKVTLEDVMNEIKGIKEQHRSSLEAVMNEIKGIKEQHRSSLEAVMNEIKEIKTRLDRHDELFKKHGWMD